MGGDHKLDPRTKSGYYWIYLYSKDGGLASYADNAYVTKIKHTDFKESPVVFDRFYEKVCVSTRTRRGYGEMAKPPICAIYNAEVI